MFHPHTLIPVAQLIMLAWACPSKLCSWSRRLLVRLFFPPLLPPKGILYLGERSSVDFCQLCGMLYQALYIKLLCSFNSFSESLAGGVVPGRRPRWPSLRSVCLLATLPITSIPGGRHYNLSSHQKSWHLKKSKRRDSGAKEITNQCQDHWWMEGRLEDGGWRAHYLGEW